jgi:hypothetical protein
MLHPVLVYLHLLGMAVLVGGFTAQLTSGQRRISPGQWHGALLSLISGLALVAWSELASPVPPNHARVAVKLVLALAITVLAWCGRRRQSWPQGWLTLGILALVTTAVAVFWQ